MKECGNPIQVEKISDDVKEYINLKTASVKLGLVEELSSFTGKTLAIILMIFLFSSSLTFFAAAGVMWIGALIGSYPWAAVMMGGLLILIGLILYLCRNGLVSIMVPVFSKMFFPEPKEKKSYDDDEED